LLYLIIKYQLISNSGRNFGLKRTEAPTCAVTLRKPIGSAATLNLHLHCLVLDGVYRTTEGVPVFHSERN
jgi:hypothetical protein